MNGKSSSGFSLAGTLLIVFIVLKLCKVITWSWIWVLSPFWIGLIVWLAAAVVLAILKNKLGF